jgi:hypothetical protein
MVGKVQKLHGVDVLMGIAILFPLEHRHAVHISPHAISGFFSNPEKELFKARNFEVINGLQHVFEKWVERCMKYIACQGWYFEKETVTAPPQSFYSE